MPKLTDKTALTTIATNDLLHVVDVSDTSSDPAGTSKKITVNNFIQPAKDYADNIVRIESLNGLNHHTQGLATGTAGTDFTITSDTDTHTFDLPDASTTARGVVTTGNQTFAGVKTLMPKIQNQVSNGSTIIDVSPNGTSQVTGINLNNNSTPSTGAYLQAYCGSSEMGINITRYTGGLLPFKILLDGSSLLEIATNGNLTYSGLARRVLADLSNATRSNRLNFQTTTSNSSSGLGVLPSGTGTLGAFISYGNSDPDNASIGQFHCDTSGGHVGINSTKSGTGVTQPIKLQIDNTDKVTVATTGVVSLVNSMRTTVNTLTDGATITPDFSNNDFKVQLAGARTLANPTNLGSAQSGTLSVYQDGTGSRTLTPATNSFYTPTTAIPLSTGKYVKDIVPYFVQNYATSTVTMIIATPCVVTWTAHGLTSGDKVTFSTTGALPTPSTGLAMNVQLYYVNVINANTFNLSTTLANLQAGTYVATSGSQSGTHTAVSANIVLGTTILGAN